MSSTLPKIGQKVWAWSPQYKKELPITVTHIKGNKFWGDDNQLNRHTGLQRWRPAEDKPKTQKGEKLKGDQLCLIEQKTPAVEIPTPEIEEVPVKIDTPQIFEGQIENEWPPKVYKATIAISKIWPTLENLDEEIEEAKQLQPRTGLDEDVIERYTEVFDVLPPIDVFAIEGRDGFCLAGGWHRREAALKLGRTTIEANIHQGSWEEAIAFASTDNLQCGFQLTKNEVKEACKNFLRIADSLPAQVVEQLVGNINRRFNKQGKDLSDVMISKMFGISDRTVANYRKEIKLEKLVDQFSVGQRVTVETEGIPADYCRGFIKSINETTIWVEFDFPQRSPQHSWTPDKVKISSEPIAKITIPEKYKPGDKVKHWCTGKEGIVASVEWMNPGWCWGMYNPSVSSPVILFDDCLEVGQCYEYDIIGEDEPPTLEECIEKIKEEQQTTSPRSVYAERLQQRLTYLEQYLPTSTPTISTPALTEPTPAPAPAAAPAVTTEQETQQLGQSLGLNGKSAQVLPDHPRNEYTGTESNKNNDDVYQQILWKSIRNTIKEINPNNDEAIEILKELLPYLPEDFKEQFEYLIEEREFLSV